MIDGIYHIQSNYSIESIKRLVTKSLRVVAQNEIQKGFFNKNDLQEVLQVKCHM